MNTLIVIITTCVLFLFPLRIKQKVTRYFYYIVCGFISLTLFVSIANPFELYEVSTKAYVFISLGFIFWGLGYIKRHRVNHNTNVIVEHDSVSSLFKSRRLFFTYVASFCFLLYLAITQWQFILINGAMLNLKTDTFEIIFNNNSMMYLFYQCVSFPLFYLSIALFSYLYITKGSRLYLTISFLYILLFCYIGGKRGYFQTTIEGFFIIYILVNLKKGLSLFQMMRSSYRLLIFICILYLGAAYMTSIGGGGGDLKSAGNENAKNLVVYNVGAYRAFDYALDKNFYEKSNGPHYGAATFGGFIEYYSTNIFNRIGLNTRSVRENTMTLLQDTPITVGNGVDFNFLYTSFMYFYFDFGVLGILLISFMFGWFVRYIVDVFAFENTFSSIGLVSYIFISCILFPAGWFNVALSAQPTLLMFYVLRNNELKKERL